MENILLYSVQAFSFLACIVSAVVKEKKHILFWVFVANLSNFAVMLIAKETDGWANSFATTLRALLFLYKDKSKTNFILYFSIALHIIAFVLSYQNIYSLLLITATLCVCITQWFGNSVQIKIGAFISVICWCIYTIHIGLYLDLPKRIIEGIFLIIALTRLYYEKQKGKENNNVNQIYS